MIKVKKNYSTQRAIAAKARSIFDEIQHKGGNETFTVSKGKFARFQKR
jgi:hypothetical protein